MMTPQQIEIVKSTVPVLRENGVTLTSYFYQRMLKNNPELKNVFNLDHQSTGRQPRALAAAVLAYAENIENPGALGKAVERMTTKHVSLDIQPDQYMIVGENLLHSISEVLNVPFESDLIEAWKQAYLQLADIMIGVEKQKYDTLAHNQGGWAGWREFEIKAVEAAENGKRMTIAPKDGKAVTPAEAGHFISVKVHVKKHGIDQPQQFTFVENQGNTDYSFIVTPEENPTEFSVAKILLEDYQVGDSVEVTAPVKL